MVCSGVDATICNDVSLDRRDGSILDVGSSLGHYWQRKRDGYLL
jgi:hypothetical protein